jgi:hypothetical protein
MTPKEFKAWFEGFTEAFTGVPTKAQWARIKERVGEIDGQPVTERVYVDRWWPAVRPYFAGGLQPGWQYLSAGLSVGSNLSQAQCYNSSTAMYAVGKADAASLS